MWYCLVRTVVTSEVMSAVLLEPAAALSFSLQSIHYNTIIVPIYIIMNNLSKAMRRSMKLLIGMS